MPENKSISKVIELNEDLIDNNIKLAHQNNKKLKEYDIKSIEIVGAIGAGKTSILEMLISKISKNYMLGA